MTGAEGMPAERDRLMAALHEIAKLCLASLELGEILDGAAPQIVSAGIFRSLMIALVDHEAHQVEVVRNFLSFRGGAMSRGNIKPGGVLKPVPNMSHTRLGHLVQQDQRIVGTTYHLDDDNITAEVARTGEMALIHGDSERFDARFAHVRVEGQVSYFIPVNHQGRCAAVLATGSEASELDEMLSRIEAMGPLLDQFAIALQHAALFEETRESHRQLQQVNRRLQEEIDERRRVDELLRQSQKMQAVGQLTAGVAHNFNNYLMAILGNLERLEMAGVVNESLDLARDAGVQAADMVRQLMVFSRAEERSPRQPLDIPSAVTSAITIARRTFDRSIVLHEETPEGLPAVSGDAGQLEQLFLNLLLNARDAVTKAGRHPPRIDVAIDTVDLTAEEMSVRISAGASAREFVRVAIADNGVGMSEEVRQQVFDPFFTTKSIGEGTGLGLATAYGVAKQHDGWIECTSREGGGSTFAVMLPAVEAEVEKATVQSPVRARGGSETILVVEDEESVRLTVTEVMERYGYRVLVAVDGKAGWDLFSNNADEVDLVFLDLSLPAMSGQEVLRRIHQSAPGTRVIISTGHSDVGEVEDECVLRKPYKVAEALAVVRDMLDGHR